MGTARWDPADWDRYRKSVSSKSASAIFSSHTLDPDLDPRGITFRESCDSALNPASTPIIVAVDVTGSMGVLAEVLVRQGLGLMIEEIYDRKPVTDPHVMCMAIGDAWCDSAPLQATQFEADIRLVSQLTKFFIERGGGGNSFESYNLPWYFAANKTKCDAIVKRHKKGYLFTVGDEPPPPVLEAKHIQEIFGDKVQHNISSRDLLATASVDWEIFHIMITQGSYYQGHPKEVSNRWKALLGERALTLSDHKKLAELIVSIMEVTQGSDVDKVASSWERGTAMVVRNALQQLPTRSKLAPTGKGVARL